MKDKIDKFLASLDDEDILRYAYNQKCDIPVYYSGPSWDREELSAAISSLVCGQWLSSGEEVTKFEKQFAQSEGVNSALMVNSGSSANLVLLAACKKHYGWSDDSEIVVSVVGFPTTIAPIVQNNMVPKFVDIEMDSLNFNLELVEEAITDKTVAIFLSPVLGNPCDMEELSRICMEKDVMLLLDGCDSFGTQYLGQPLAKYATATTCSFYPAHHITTGEGGMVYSDDTRLIQIARSIAWWGRDCFCVGSCNLLANGMCNNRFSNWLPDYDGIVDHKYVFTNVGYNLKPLDLQGAIGQVQLKKAPKLHERRQRNKIRISSIMSKVVSGIRIPLSERNSTVSWFGVPIICCNDELKLKLVSFLEANKIQTRNYFAGNILMHPAYRDLGNFRDYPNANEVLERVFFLGTSPSYSETTFDYIEDVMKKWQE